MQVRQKRRSAITAASERFEQGVRELAAEMGIEEWRARKIKRITNVLDHLAGEVAADLRCPEGVSPAQYAETFRAALHSRDRLAALIQADEMSQTFLAWALNSIFDAKKLVLSENSQGAMEVMTHVAGLMFGAAKRLSDDARANAATKAAIASHSTHYANKKIVRDWYSEHRGMTKDAAAEKIVRDGIVHASFRTVRKYLVGM